MLLYTFVQVVRTLVHFSSFEKFSMEWTRRKNRADRPQSLFERGAPSIDARKGFRGRNDGSINTRCYRLTRRTRVLHERDGTLVWSGGGRNARCKISQRDPRRHFIKRHSFSRSLWRSAAITTDKHLRHTFLRLEFRIRGTTRPEIKVRREIPIERSPR